jgi:hypothetical protein
LVKQKGGIKELHLRGLTDATIAAAQLEALVLPSLSIPTKVLAAVNVLKKAQKGQYVFGKIMLKATNTTTE